MDTFSTFTCVSPGFGGVICGQDPHESNGRVGFWDLDGNEERSWLWERESLET